MRKSLLLLSIFLLFGCTKIDKNNLDYQEYLNSIIISDSNYVNKSSVGFKYYLPKGVIVKHVDNNNIIFSCGNIKMFLFVDVVSHFYNKKILLSSNESYDYIKHLNNDGIVTVDENNGSYLVKIIYNSSVIEFITKKNDLSKLLVLSTIILNSIEFNDEIIGKELANSINNSNDSIYEIEDITQKNSRFSQYLNSLEEEKNEDIKLPD